MTGLKHTAYTGEMRHANYILLGNLKGKKPPARFTDRRKDNNANLKEIWWNSVNWIYLSHDREESQVLVNSIKNPCLP
jgi:hypothetical protein